MMKILEILLIIGGLAIAGFIGISVLYGANYLGERRPDLLSRSGYAYYR